MPRVVRPVGHEEHLSLVEHLDELRTRLIVSLVAIGVAFAFCFWQNHALLKLIGDPYAKETQSQVKKCQGEQGPVWCTDQALKATAHALTTVIKVLENPANGLKATSRTALDPLIAGLNNGLKPLPKTIPANSLVTIGIGEPFTATITVTFYFSLLLSLPIILYELYGFMIPAFSPTERAVARPVLMAVPGLFACGVVFGYFVVLPAAVHFLQNFNSGSFEQFVQASSYYSFAALIMLAMGVIFQVPLAVVAAVAGGDRDDAAAAQEPALRDRRRSFDRSAAARRRGDDDTGDAADHRALRGRYPGGRVARPSRRPPGACAEPLRRSDRNPATATASDSPADLLRQCFLISAARTAGGSSRSSTCSSRC